MSPKAKPEKLVKEVKLNSIYLPDRQWEWLEYSWLHLGYSPRSIAKNALQGFFAANRNFYAQAALRDAESRGMQPRDHYIALRDGGELAPIIKPANHPASPIAWVPSLVSQENKRRYSTIEISAYNYTLLQMAVILDGGSLPNAVSKCIYAHLGELYSVEKDNPRSSAWAKSYYPQIKLNEDCCYTIEQWKQDGNNTWEEL